MKTEINLNVIKEQIEENGRLFEKASQEKREAKINYIEALLSFGNDQHESYTLLQYQLADFKVMEISNTIQELRQEVKKWMN